MYNYEKRKLSRNEILKAMECYDRYPYIPFWYIIKEISEKPGIAAEDLNYWFKYGYGHADKNQIMQAYDPDPETKKIYKHMGNYIDRREECLPISTNLHEKNDYILEYMNYQNYKQALNERNYWRGARNFIEKYLPKEIDTDTQQENNIAKARKFGRKAYKYVGDIIARNNMSSSDPRAIAMHGTIGGMIAKMCGKYYIQGEELGEINKAIVAQIYENKKKIGFSDSDVIAFSRQLGEHLGNSLGLGSKLGGEIAEMATKWNTYGQYNDLSFNVNLFERIYGNKIKRFGVVNYGLSKSRPAGHSGVFVVLDDGNDTMLEVGFGPEYGADEKTIILGKARGEFYIKKIDPKYFETTKESVSLHTFNDFNDEHKKRFLNNLQSITDGKSSLGELERKEYVDGQRFVSKNVAYNASYKNCVNNTLDILKATNGEIYSVSGENIPHFLGLRLAGQKGWNTQYFNKKTYKTDGYDYENAFI